MSHIIDVYRVTAKFSEEIIHKTLHNLMLIFCECSPPCILQYPPMHIVNNLYKLNIKLQDKTNEEIYSS